MDEKIVPHLEESNRELGDLEKTDIHAEFNKRLSFHMQQDVTKKSSLSKFRGKTKVLKVKDLSANLKNFEIIGSIQDLGEKQSGLRMELKKELLRFITGSLQMKQVLLCFLHGNIFQAR